MNRRKRKLYFKKHKELLEQILAILDEVDPMGIIFSAQVGGFDISSEYLPEAKAVVLRLDRWNGVRSLEADLKQVFDYYFSYPDISPEYFQIAARRIWNARLLSLGKPSVDFPDDIKPPEHEQPVIIEID